MQEWMFVPLQRYAEFSGRSRRKEYWYYALLLFIVNIIVSIIEKIMGWTLDDLGLLSGLIALLTIIPSIAVGVRRLHDIDRSGWWMLISFIPIIGLIVILYFMIQPGTSGYNRFGPDPITD